MENSILQEQALASQLAAPPSDLVTLLPRRIGPINCHKRLWLTSTSINQASSPRIDQPVSFFCLDQRAWAKQRLCDCRAVSWQEEEFSKSVAARFTGELKQPNLLGSSPLPRSLRNDSMLPQQHLRKGKRLGRSRLLVLYKALAQDVLNLVKGPICKTGAAAAVS